MWENKIARHKEQNYKHKCALERVIHLSRHKLYAKRVHRSSRVSWFLSPLLLYFVHCFIAWFLEINVIFCLRYVSSCLDICSFRRHYVFDYSSGFMFIFRNMFDYVRYAVFTMLAWLFCLQVMSVQFWIACYCLL